MDGVVSPHRSGTRREAWLRHMAALSRDEAYHELGTRPEGLTSAEVEASRERHGANAPGRARRPSPIRRFLSSFADPFTSILVGIAIVSVLMDCLFSAPESRDASMPLIICAIVLISGVLRFIQDERSAHASEALANLIKTTCAVRRGSGERREIPLDEVVVGDVVQLGPGDLVPAELRIVAARDLFVNQAALTGESQPVEKSSTLDDRAPVAAAPVTDLIDLAFMGTTVVSGTGEGIAMATGSHTLMGEVSDALTEGTDKTTAFDEGVGETSRLLVRIMLTMVPIVFALNCLTKGTWLDALLFSLSVAVGLTPEMLPMLVTTCLSKGAVDMSRERVITKRLDSICDLGAIDILCTDKTGTLTENRVELVHYLDPQGTENPRVLHHAFLNSYFETGLRNLIDGAIIRRADDEKGALIDGWKRVDELPFDFERRRVSVVLEDAAGRTRMVTKGALAETLGVCSMVELGDAVRPLTPQLRDGLTAQARQLADQGMRVLGVALLDDPVDVGALTTADERDMTFVGSLAFMDPPKRSASEAIAALAAHGVETKVLTGDSARVAVHVCQELDIPLKGTLTGTDVGSLDDRALARTAQDVTVFAKLTPMQKARVVHALRSQGHAVGFMGDGVNDAPAMRESDCGISVDTAADVARESADIILLEKNLMVLEHGIECGRRTFQNMLKYVEMTVSSNFGNIFSVLVAAAFLPFLPMTAVQLLLLNLIYDVSCTAIPWDGVDDELVRSPCGWSTRAIQRTMLRLGPVSSVFDLLTYALLFLVVCPSVCGGAWETLDAAGQTLFAATFQAGWFIQSMWSQVLLVHLIRTRRVPFIQSHAAAPVIALSVAAVALATAIPFTPLAGPLGLSPPPTFYFGLLVAVIAGYACSVLCVRRLAHRPHRP